MNPFDEKYYTSLNYVGYLNRSGKYDKLCEEIVDFLNCLSLIKKDSKILDYGCAVGFLLDAFYKRDFKNTHGYDISEFALSKLNKNHKIINLNENQEFDFCFMLDVLEHIDDENIQKIFSKIQANILVVRIPCSLDGKDFYLEVSKNDKTHINCKKKTDWVKFINSFGYSLIGLLNLKQIYDSDGVFCGLFFKNDFIQNKYN